MFIPMRIIVMLDHENDAVMINNSPIRLMDGGRARFVRLDTSHHVAMSGRSVCSPRARIMVRLCTRS